jgi:D-aminopeptidase
MARKPRARELGLQLEGTPGPHNAITDVAGVAVGYATLVLDSPTQIRTGVTAILPRGHAAHLSPVWAGFHSLNGNGEFTGIQWINHAGYFYGPICITNTHSVGAVHTGVTRWMIDTFNEDFSRDHLWALPVVAETYDGVLNDINAQYVTPGHVRQAIDSASTQPPLEGNVGGGTGMITYEFKGGTGTASQVIELAGETFTVAALVQANHGLRDWLTICGRNVGKQLNEGRLYSQEQGSIIVVLATDIPMLPHQLQRVAQRASIGIGRHGTPGGNNSGDMFLAFSTANAFDRKAFTSGKRMLECVPDEWFDAIYLAAVRATEEAVINAMLAAEDMETFKPKGKVCRAIDHQALFSALGLDTSHSSPAAGTGS